MARTISTKLAVEGEAQYKQAITACNQQLATLKSQLALTESEFRGQANSMEALQAKGKALQGMYDKQADKVEKIRSALVNCEKAQSEYARRVAEAEDNIYAYEASLEKLKNSTEDTTEEQEKLQEGLAQWKKELAEATAGQEAAERGVQNWQKQLNYAGVELNDLSDRIQQNDQYMKEAAGSADGCANSIDQYGDAVKDAGDASEDFGEESVSAVDALAQAMVAAGIADKAKEVAEALYDCVKTYGDFASQMSAVQAISGATGKEMEALSQKAQQMGQTTSFTAKEAGQALEYMAMAGWKTGDMLDGLEGIMNLAAASGEDLAMVSDIVTDGLTAFGMAADESAHFADVLAAASANSNTNVAMLGESFSYVAPVAGALGYSLEDVSVALGLMANAGIKGSSAGTALRGTLTNLAKPTKQVDGYMQALGVSLADSTGQVKPLSRLLGELREKFSGLTDAQKAQYAAGIAGKEAMSGLLAVVNASDADFEKLTAAINDCNGAAERMAQVRLDNFEGQVTLLNSALDGLKMTIGSQLAPLFEAVASGATSATNALSGLLEACPWLSSALLGLVSAAGAAALAIKGLAVANAVKAALGGLAAALAANPYAAAAVAIVGVGTALASLAAYFADATSAAGKMPAALGEINKAYEQSSTEINATAAAAENLVARLDVLGQQESLTAEEAAAYAQTVDQLKTLMPELNLEIDEHTGKLRDGTEAVREQIAALQEQALAQAMQEKYASILEEQAQAMVDLAEKQVDYKVALADMEAIYAQMQATAEELNRVERDCSLTYDEKQAKIAELQGRMMELSSAYTAAQDETNRLSDAVKESEGMVSQFDEALDKAQATAEQLPGAFQESGGAVEDFGGRIDDAVEKMISLESAYMETAEEALKSAESQFKMWDDLSGKVEESEVDIEKALESQEKYWTDLTDNITDLSNRGIEGMDGLIASLNDGSVEGAAAIESLSKKSDGELKNIVEQYSKTKDAQSKWAGESSLIINGYATQVSGIFDQIATDAQKMDVSDEALQDGINTIQGYIDGVEQMEDALVTAMTNASQKAWASFKKPIGIASPSKAFRESGHDTIDGYILGIEDQSGPLQKAMGLIAKVAQQGFEKQINSSNPADVFADAISEKFKELDKVYEEATESAKKSAQKQFDLFDDLTDKSKKSSTNLLDSLQAQEQYWNKLTNNIENLTARNVEGLDKIVEAMNDGTEKGAEAIANLSAKSDEGLTAIVTHYNDLQAAQERWAASSTNAKKSTDELYAALEKLNISQKDLAISVKEGSANQELYNFYAEATVEKLNELDKAYEEAAAAALDSAQSQFELWDDLSQKSEESTVDLVNSLKAQEEYWNALSDNVENLTTRNIKGLTEMVNAMNDGSQKGAQYISQLARKTDPELKVLVQQYENTKNAQESWANASANALTSYQSKVDETIGAFQDSVQKMNMADQASQAGSMTLQGFINGLNSKSPSVYSTMNLIANSAWGIFKKALMINSPSKLFWMAGDQSMEGYELGVEDHEDQLNRQMEEMAKKAVSSFEDAIPAITAAERKLFAQASQSVTLEASARETQNAPSVTNYFDVRGMVVREEADIDKIARKLSTMLTREMRGRGLRW